MGILVYFLLWVNAGFISSAAMSLLQSFVAMALRFRVAWDFKCLLLAF